MSVSTSATRAFSPVVFQKQRTYKRLASRTVSSSGINTTHARIRPTALPDSESINSEEDSTRTQQSSEHATTTAISSSGSESKLSRKRRKRAKAGASDIPDAYAYIFKLVFIACLVLFVHALSGIGAKVVPPEPEQRQQEHEHVQERSRHLRFSRFPGSNERNAKNRLVEIGHDHLAIDPDGHYTYSAVLADTEEAYRWRWGMKGSNYTRVDLAIGDGNAITASGEDTRHLPLATVEGTRHASLIPERKDGPDVHNTPPPSPSPPPPPPAVTLRADNDIHTSVCAPSHESIDRKPNSVKDDAEGADGFEMDLPFFELGGPVYPLRIHLPATKASAVPEEHRRGRRRAARARTYGAVAV
ncbi:hypothetical protein ACEPAF_9990 [Sanghuangporus sanghuang]